MVGNSKNSWRERIGLKQCLLTPLLDRRVALTELLLRVNCGLERRSVFKKRKSARGHGADIPQRGALKSAFGGKANISPTFRYVCGFELVSQVPTSRPA